MFYVYIIRTTGNTLYTGQTDNLDRRIREHTSHGWRASKYIKKFLGCKLVYSETCSTRSEAMHREAEIKKFTHNEKEALIEQSQTTKTGSGKG